MTNEEKILVMLEKLAKGQEELRSDITEIRGDITEMRGDITEMQATLSRVAVTQEGLVLPRLQLLYEGHVNLQETLAPKERVEVLEDRVITLETTVKSMSNRLAVLEKAQ